jgi:hypothetical protein
MYAKSPFAVDTARPFDEENVIVLPEKTEMCEASVSRGRVSEKTRGRGILPPMTYHRRKEVRHED